MSKKRKSRAEIRREKKELNQKKKTARYLWFLPVLAVFVIAGISMNIVEIISSPSGPGAASDTFITDDELESLHVSADDEHGLFDAELISRLIMQYLHEVRGDSGLPDIEDLPEKDMQGPVYIVLRDRGLRRTSHWETADYGWEEKLVSGLNRAGNMLAERNLSDTDMIEIVLTYDYRDVHLTDQRRRITNVHRGLRGLELSTPDKTVRFSPTDMIARNLSFDNAVRNFSRAVGMNKSRVKAMRGVSARTFEGYQFLVSTGEEPEVVRMYRGNRIVEPEEVTRESVLEMSREMGDWLVRMVNPDGRMTYRWFPSVGEESTANNLIRQFMATVCLGRKGVLNNDPSITALVDQNLRYNFKTFHKREGDLVFVEKWDQVKLGAVALAGLAIVEHPNREDFREYEEGFLRTIDHLWQEDGSFRTFYKPPTRNDNQNFYPGEALLLWGTLYHENPDPVLLDKFMKSFRYYRQWHLENRNPAFIPWHTQAYYLVWEVTRDQELADFIFKMNDWLLDVQQWDNVVYPDTRGRFYDPNRPFGPPHASSTGVYIEGLIDAYALADRLGDEKRKEAYRIAMIRALRSIMQLQYKDDTDMFYISMRDKVRGGIRTTVYDNTIRIDNVQHPLMGIQKILQLVDDFSLPENSR